MDSSPSNPNAVYPTQPKPKDINGKNTFYVSVGGMEPGSKYPAIFHIDNPSYRLGSPRTINFSDNPIVFPDGAVVYYFHLYKSEEDKEYEDIHDFVFSCCASKNVADSFYYLGKPKSFEEMIKYAEENRPYILASGTKLPDRKHSSQSLSSQGLSNEDDAKLCRNLMVGLRVFSVLFNSGLDNKKSINEGNSKRIISTGGHRFIRGEDWVLDTSNIFTGSVIDYYRISSGIVGESAQQSFIDDAQYRFVVFDYMSLVFFNLCKENLPDYQKNRVKDNMSKTELIKLSIEVIQKWYLKSE